MYIYIFIYKLVYSTWFCFWREQIPFVVAFIIPILLFHFTLGRKPKTYLNLGTTFIKTKLENDVFAS